MSVTLLTARTEVRALLAETSSAYWTDAQINSWINQGCEDVARRAEILWNEAQVNCTVGVQQYPFPSDFLSCHRAEYTINPPVGATGALTQALEFREINSMDENWGWLHGLQAAWPRWFTIRGNSVVGLQFMMYPAPGTAGVATVYYYRQAVAAASDTANIDTLSGWEDIVYDYAVFKAQRAARSPLWKDAFQLYEKNLAAMIDKTRNWTDLTDTISTGAAQWPIYQFSSGDDW